MRKYVDMRNVRCEICLKPHLYNCYERTETMILWFCGEACKLAWTQPETAESLREFRPHGGWQ
jgi:hypothetical protein